MKIRTEDAEAAIAGITAEDVEAYSSHLSSMAPTSNEELFKRWLFAYASVHTTWAMNCRLYSALLGLDWVKTASSTDVEMLFRLITEAKAGMHNKRTDYITRFTTFFEKHPSWFWKADHEKWAAYRDRVMNAAPGIGRAKSSFVIEMTYPTTADVICTDTHIMQLYGATTSEIGRGRVGTNTEKEMERHWVDTCRAHCIPPVIARWVFWDKKQGKTDSRYWTYVFDTLYNDRTLFSTPFDKRQ